MGTATVTRADLLLSLIKKNRTWDDDMFEKLVPHRYGELYSLYNILDKADALDNCTVKLPTFFNDTMSVQVNTTKKIRKSVKDYLETKKFRVKYLKTDEFTIGIEINDTGLYFTFTRVDD